MQTLRPRNTRVGRIVLFVPRWLPADASPSGLPYKVFPVLSSLAGHGFQVDFFTEVHDSLDTRQLRATLLACDGAVVWCPELNPGVQVPGVIRFLEIAREVAPAATRVAGGGFFYLLPERTRRLDGLADVVLTDHGVPSVARCLAERRGVLATSQNGRTMALDPYALLELDLRPFFREESMLFGNADPSLQIPTGFGCAKHCDFCFYEETNPQLMPATQLVDLIDALSARYGLRQFLFGELDFFASRKRVVDVARRLVDRQIDIRWFALVSVGDIERLSDADLDLVAESGCHVLEIGTEVGSTSALHRIGKRFEIGAAVRSAERLLTREIVPLHNMMFGFVGETARDRRDTLAVIRRLRSLSSRVRFNFRVYQAAPNTTMGAEALRLLPEFPDTFWGLLSYRMEMEDGRAMPWLSPSEEREVKFLAHYVLPLAYDDSLHQGSPSWTRRALRHVAAARCRLGMFRLPADRKIFERVERVGLAGTFLP